MHERSTGNPATDFSLSLLSEFARLGVRDFVLSPGSRSQALALVAAELERQAAIRLHVRVDERVAAFTALGLTLETRRPTVVITTSGTATANLHPAVLEAHHSGVPMILLTADRPAELRGIRSNQTTVQPGMFADAVRAMQDLPAPDGRPTDIERALMAARFAFDAAQGLPGGDPGPVHLNVAFREPLSVAVPPATVEPRGARAESAGTPAHPRRDRPTVSIPAGIRTVVIAGADAGEAAEALARAGGWPLIAEVSSGARYGPNLVVSYRELLRYAAFGGLVERAIVFGHPTLSREVPALVSRDDVELIVVAPYGGEVYNPRHRAARIVGAVVPAEESATTPAAREWVGRWVFASRAILDEGAGGPTSPGAGEGAGGGVGAGTGAGAGAGSGAPAAALSASSRGAEARAQLARERAAAVEPISRRMLVTAVWQYTWPHERLVVGASRLIREADRLTIGKKLRVYANRGLAGIDGTISTATGVALAARAEADDAGRPSGITRVLLGDLAVLHDVGALLQAPGEPAPHLQVVVGNDGGGTIFDSLEVAATASESAMERVMYTPRAVDLRALAAAYGWAYSRASTREELEAALSAPPPGPSILEVVLPR